MESNNTDWDFPRLRYLTVEIKRMTEEDIWKQEIGGLVRDFTQVGSIPKSEGKRRIIELLDKAYEKGLRAVAVSGTLIPRSRILGLIEEMTPDVNADVLFKSGFYEAKDALKTKLNKPL